MKMDSVIISYSGGIDSLLLSYLTSKYLKNKKIICLFINTNMISQKNINFAVNCAKKYNLQYKIIDNDFTSIPDIKKNNKNRCYFCKKKILSLLINYAKNNGYNYILDGNNASDVENKYRPGMKALNYYKNLKTINL